MIKQVQHNELDTCLLVIRESFADVAHEFNLTKENCPNHTSFITMDILKYHWDNGFLMYGFYLGDEAIGYVSLENKGNTVFELRNLSVLPEYRKKGYGEQLLAFCKIKVKELNGTKISIGIIEENIKLKNWYIRNGFIHTGTKQFDHLPFTVGYMECPVYVPDFMVRSTL